MTTQMKSWTGQSMMAWWGYGRQARSALGGSGNVQNQFTSSAAPRTVKHEVDWDDLIDWETQMKMPPPPPEFFKLEPPCILSKEEVLEKKVEDFDFIRRQSYKEINMGHERVRLVPWYIITLKEMKWVGFWIPFKLVIHPNHEYIKEVIQQEGQ